MHYRATPNGAREGAVHVEAPARDRRINGHALTCTRSALYAGGELVAEHERMAENRIADGPSEYQ